MNSRTERFQRFYEEVRSVARAFVESSRQGVVLIHHNDTDGLTSGAILERACERLSIPRRRYVLEKPYTEALSLILDQPFGLSRVAVVLADFGSGMLELLEAINAQRHDLFVLDHHAVKRSTANSVRLLNPREWGISGDVEASASVVCALFAEHLGKWNQDLLKLGVLGAIGDSQLDAQGRCQGLTAELADRACAKGSVTFTDGYGFRYAELADVLSGNDLKGWVDSLGSFAYLSGGPDVAVKGLLEGFDGRYRTLAERANATYRNAVDPFLSTYNPRDSSSLVSFTLPDSFDQFGVKTVGLVCEEIVASGRVRGAKYVAGFQKVPDQIPGLGPVRINQSKLSMRVTPELSAAIFADRAPGVDRILIPAAQSLGGVVDACHRAAGAVTVARGNEALLLERIAREVSGTSLVLGKSHSAE